jgi:hypothetical protein
MRFQGRQGHMTQVISFYRPCHAANKEGSVWEQQVQYFRGKLELDKNPREAFYEDLFLEIETWKQLGDHIVIAGDVNKDVRQGMTSEFFLALGLREVILERHLRLSPPATNDKNNSRVPIDSIWASQELQVNAAGYLPFGEGCKSDHQLLWADLSYHTVFGRKTPKTYHIPVKKLRSDDPRLVKRYNRKVKAALNREGLIKQAFALQNNITNQGWNLAMETEYNRIHSHNVKIRTKAERTCKSSAWAASTGLQNCKSIETPSNSGA